MKNQFSYLKIKWLALCLLGFTTLLSAHIKKQVDFHRLPDRSASNILLKQMITPGMVLDIGSNLDQNHFKLQYAVSGDEKYIEVSQEEIAAGFARYPYFTVIPYADYNAVQFWVQVDAPTTGGSSFPRSELRQTNPDGSNASFNALQGTHWLQGKTRITHLPSEKPAVVIMQLFDGSVDQVSIRTQLIKGEAYLLVRINQTAVKPFLMKPYILNTEFEWKVLVENGVVSVYYNDMETPIISNQALQSTGKPSWYFKAGCYAQTNSQIEQNPNEYVSTELRDLRYGEN